MELAHRRQYQQQLFHVSFDDTPYILMEFDSREAQDLNLEIEKKYIFYSLVLWVSIALGLSICILLNFLAFFLCLLFFCVEGGGCICSRNRNDNGNRNRNLSAYEVGIIIFVTQLKCSQMQIANGKRQMANGKRRLPCGGKV